MIMMTIFQRYATTATTCNTFLLLCCGAIIIITQIINVNAQPQQQWSLSPHPNPSTNPSISMSMYPSPAPTECIDVSNWKDAAGDSCEWYAAVDYPDRCNRFGNDYKHNGFTAYDACCVCDGGFMLSNIKMPSVMPSTSPTGSPSGTLICIDDMVWRDEDGQTCSDYERDLDDDEYFLAGETACSLDQDRNGDAQKYCCVCGGGYKDPFVPSLIPTMTNAPSTSLNQDNSPSYVEGDSACMNIIGWLDAFDEGCAYYETPFEVGSKNENSTKCETYGSSGIRNGYTAVSKYV